MNGHPAYLLVLLALLVGGLGFVISRIVAERRRRPVHRSVKRKDKL